MTITKRSLCVLKYIYRKRIVTYSQLNQKFRHRTDLHETVTELLHAKYIGQLGGSYNKYGEPLPIENLTKFKLENAGIVEVESNQWFTSEYVLTSLIIPIIVGVASSVITALILLFF